jgi:hypothetical protein
MKKLLIRTALVAFVGAAWVVSVLHFGSDAAYARPEYSKAFLAKYADLKPAAEAKCNVCHFGESKKNRNEYGKAVGKALGEPKVKDTAKINAALSKAENDKASDGKTFGERIKAGMLPSTKD